MSESLKVSVELPDRSDSELSQELAKLRHRVAELERYRSLFEQAPVSIWVEDWSAAKPLIEGVIKSDGATLNRFFRDSPDLVCRIAGLVQVLDHNETTALMYRAPRKATFRRLAEADFLTRDEYLAFCDTLAALARGETRFSVHGWERTFDGNRIYVRDTVFVPEPYRETWSRVVHASEDESERKRAEDALRESEALLRRAACLGRLGHWVWDEVEDRCDYCSEQLAEIHGLTVAEYRAKTTCFAARLERIHSQDRARYAAAVEEAYQQGGTYDIDYRLIKSGGKIGHVRELASTSLDAAGRPVRTIGTLQDLTWQKRRQAAQAELSSRLDGLTSRERQVLDLIVAGETNNGAADLLGITSKTVEAHRAHMMKKLAARSFADLMSKVVSLRVRQELP